MKKLKKLLGKSFTLPRSLSGKKECDKIRKLIQSPTEKSIKDIGDQLFDRGASEAACQIFEYIYRKRPSDEHVVPAIIDCLLDRALGAAFLPQAIRSIVRKKPKYMDFLPRAYIEAGDLPSAAVVFNIIVKSGSVNHTYKTIIETSNVLIDYGHYRKACSVISLWFTLVGKITPRICCSMARASEAIDPQKSNRWYRRASGFAPDDPTHSCNYALSLFRLGDFKEGFHYYQKKHIRTFVDKPFVDRPLPKSLKGLAGKKIFVYQEQGLGDSLQFIRFLPILQKTGADISLCVPQTLSGLFKSSFKGVTFIGTKLDKKDAKDYDYSIPIPFLPYICGFETYQDMPSDFPYLKVDKKDKERMRTLLDLITKDAEDSVRRTKPRIGLVWSGKRRTSRGDILMDRRRSIDFRTFIEAITPIDATLVSLQFGDRENDIKTFDGQEIVDVMPCVRNMLDTAALMTSLDLIITVDTSMSHLAGALLACPVWLIERWGTCWRWGYKGMRTPWYPRMRIFRRNTFDPKVVMAEVGAELKKWVSMYPQNLETEEHLIQDTR